MPLDRVIPITLVFMFHIWGIYVLQTHPATTVITPKTKEIVVQLTSSTTTRSSAPIRPNVPRNPRLAPKSVAHTYPVLASRAHTTTLAPIKSSELSPAATPSPALAEEPDSTTPAHPNEPSPVYQAPLFNASYLNNPPPSYPPVSRQMQENGTVILRVHVNAHGTASAVELRTSSGSKRLDNAAIEAVRHWRFVAAKLGNETIAAWVLVPIIFQLDS